MLRFFKEFAIYILIIALIVLVFGILFYEQLPSNKLIPIKEDYALPENLETALEDTLSTEEQQEVLVTYNVKESDLDKYEDSKQYNPGKIDPFSDYNVGNVTGGDNSNSSNTNGSGGGQLTETKPGK